MPVKSPMIIFRTEARRNGPRYQAFVLTCLFVLMLPGSAIAYVGPGAGITLIWALWTVLVAIVFMVGGLLLWPLRAFVRHLKNARTKEASQAKPGG